MFDYIRKAFRGRGEYDERQAKSDALMRAYAAQELLDNSAFHDAYQCELDSLVDQMLNIEPDTKERERRLLRLHARARELSNLIAHLKTFAKKREVLEIHAEKQAA